MVKNSHRKSVSLDSKRTSAPSRRSSASSARFESRSVADIRRDAQAHERTAKAQRARRVSRIPFIVIGVVTGVIVLALVSLFLLSQTKAFEIKSIDIKGTDHLTSQEVSALVSIPQGTTLLNVDPDSISSSLLRDSWVEGVEVKRVFPDTLQIDVTERKIAAIVEVPTGSAQIIQKWAVADDGTWLMAIPDRSTEIGSNLSEKIYEDAEQALHITDVPYGVKPAIGEKVNDDSVLNALSIVSGMTTELADQVKAVRAAQPESTLLTLGSNVEIAFGAAEQIREKERACLQILEANPKVVYINVRVVDRPTWKAA